jgi:tRNA A-37 threonylcarbamoyl transferase component Bud32/tetratricopeptide (TPR) repeat protein
MAAPTPDDPYLGRILDKKFSIEDLLGVGGMGRVYKATQLSLDKIVCVKVLRQGMMQDDTLVGRFHREARAASRLNHPNSIAVTDFGQAQEDGALYMAMEFVPGKDLGKIIREDWPLGEERIVHIMDQVLSALADAHAAGIIHRDLKPENIMVSDLRGTKDFVKVLDFGIAKITETATDPSLTQAGMVCGTPEYMSPEQARGEELDERSDVYATGIILYQMVVGKLPFEAPTAMGIVTKHLTEPPVPPSQVDSVQVSSAMESVILKAISKDLNGRQPTALALQQELNQTLTQKVAYAQQTPLGNDLFADEVPTGVSVTAQPAAPSAPAIAPAPKSGSKAWLVALIIVVLLGGGGTAAYFLFMKTDGQTTDPGSTTAVADAGVTQPAADAAVAEVEPKTPDAGTVAVAKETVSEAARLHYEAGKELLAQHKHKKAIAAFMKAVKKSPDYAAAYKALGMCHMSLGAIKKAKQYYRLYLKKAPDAEDRQDILDIIESL